MRCLFLNDLSSICSHIAAVRNSEQFILKYLADYLSYFPGYKSVNPGIS